MDWFARIELALQAALALYIAYRTLRQMYQSIFLVCEWVLVLAIAWAVRVAIQQYGAGATPMSLLEQFDVRSLFRSFMEQCVWSSVDNAIYYLELLKRLRPQQQQQ